MSRPGTASVTHSSGAAGAAGATWTIWPTSRWRPAAATCARWRDELGPTFVKFGQLLSLRGDVIPEEIAVELRLLQDSVPRFRSPRWSR